jgi:hypothetical protein
MAEENQAVHLVRREILKIQSLTGGLAMLYTRSPTTLQKDVSVNYLMLID